MNTGDHEHVEDAGLDEPAHGVVHHGNVAHGEKVLVCGLGERMKPTARAAGEHHAPSGAHVVGIVPLCGRS